MASLRRTPRRRAEVTEAVLVGGIEWRDLVIEEYDPTWPEAYATHHERTTRAVGELAVAAHHIGSTSVPGLAAKPIIDVLVTVADITAEEACLDPLLSAGYELRVREPGHRMVRTPRRDTHVHVVEADDPAARRLLVRHERLRRGQDGHHREHQGTGAGRAGRHEARAGPDHGGSTLDVPRISSCCRPRAVPYAPHGPRSTTATPS